MNTTLKQRIKHLLNGPLPGAKGHQLMLPPGRVLTVPNTAKKVKYSSVLLLLCPHHGDLCVHLIKRPSHMKHHAGQIALPGGKIEQGESAISTALRETQEEIGIDPALIEILGQLSPFYVEVSHFMIQPIVGWLDQKSNYTLSKDEAEKLLLFPIHLFKPPFGSTKLQTVTGELEVPCVHYQNEIIWGATAMILAEFTTLWQSVPTTSKV